MILIRSYLVNAVRSNVRQPFYSAVNVLGLALGLDCTFLIVIFVKYETSFDQFHTHADHVYRIIPRGERDGSQQLQTWTPTGFAPRLQSRFAEMEAAARFSTLDNKPTIRDDDRTLPSSIIAAADSTLFQIFDFPLYEGDRSTALRDRNSILISRSLAETVFPGESALGKVLRYNDLDWIIIPQILISSSDI